MDKVHVKGIPAVESAACICIPARLQSSRLERKLLLTLGNKTVIEHTIDRCLKTGLPVFVVTDATEIATIVGQKCSTILSTVPCRNGSERISRSMDRIPANFQHIVIVQGDEAFVHPRNINYALQTHEKYGEGAVFCTTLHEEESDTANVTSSGAVKVVTALNGDALCYSRNVIPISKDAAKPALNYKISHGLYVFSRTNMVKYQYLVDTPAQICEDIEQMKVLENGYRIKSWPAPEHCEISVNTQNDLDYLRAKYFGTRRCLNTKLVDCTLRDGGYLNQWQFPSIFAAELVRKTSRMVDAVEIGYCNTFKEGVKGSFKALTRQKISQLRGIMSPTCRLVVMVDWDDVAFDVLDPPNQEIDLIRVVFYKQDLQGAISTTERLITLGYEVSMNFMVCNTYSHEEFRAALRQSRAGTIYIADSFGCMMPDELERYADIVHEAGKKCGIHLHNNCQTAVASYLHLKDRVDLIDASVFGMGRGAGNLPLEICMTDDDDLLEVLIFIEEHVKPLFSMTCNTWGYETDFLYASRMLCHPNYVSKMRESGIPAVTRLVVLRDLRQSVIFDPKTLASTMQARAIECFALGDIDN